MPSETPNSPSFNGHDSRRKYRLRRSRHAGASRSAEEHTDGSAAKFVQIAHHSGASSDSELETLRAEFASFREEADKAKEAAAQEVLRSRAEMENQRRRLQRDREEFKKTAAADVMNKLMSPLDHFELAIRSAETAADAKSLAQGIELTHRELLQVLEGCGLVRVVPLGERFDPNFHEAIGTVNDPDRAPQEVAEVLRSGYVLAGRVLRPAMVRVNVGTNAEGAPVAAAVSQGTPLPTKGTPLPVTRNSEE